MIQGVEHTCRPGGVVRHAVAHVARGSYLRCQIVFCSSQSNYVALYFDPTRTPAVVDYSRGIASTGRLVD